MRDVSQPKVEVLLLARVQDRRSGGLLLPGETASFDPDVAADLVERGIASRWMPKSHTATALPVEYVEEVLEMDDPKEYRPTKAAHAPPMHKMVDGRKAKRK